MDIIDKKTGHFCIGDDMIIMPGQSIETILKFDLESTIWDVKTGYKWIYFKNVLLDNLYFFVSVCVYHDLVNSINFSFYEDKQELKLNWDDWSEANEIKNRDQYEKWLTDKFGSRRKFSWGNIGAFYDPKGGSSSMALRYA